MATWCGGIATIQNVLDLLFTWLYYDYMITNTEQKMKHTRLAVCILFAASLAACGGGGGGSTPVVTPPVAAAPTATVTLSTVKAKAGDNVVVTWSSTDATSCVGSDALSTSATSGTSAVSAAVGQTKFTLTCTGPGGNKVASATLGVPLPVKATSNLNAKSLNIAPKVMPTYTSTAEYSESAGSGVAFGDFQQTGELSLIVVTNRVALNPNKPNPAGVVHFYKYVDGKPVDVTSAMLADTTGCIAPRRALVADFNNDDKPDVFVSCHGAEFGPMASWAGEQPRIILSQADGTYKNTPAPITCYCHGSSAGDITGDGNIDILTSDINRARDGRSSFVLLRGDGHGNFTEDPTGFMAQEADYAMLGKAFYNGAFDVELIDFNNDGKLDVFLGTSELQNPSSIVLGDGAGKFNTTLVTFAKGTSDYHLNDAVFANGFLYVYTNLNSDQYKSQIRKYDLTTGQYVVIYDGAQANPSWSTFNDDNIFIMPYNGSLVSYDSRFKLNVKM